MLGYERNFVETSDKLLKKYIRNNIKLIALNINNQENNIDRLDHQNEIIFDVCDKNVAFPDIFTICGLISKLLFKISIIRIILRLMYITITFNQD